MATPLARAQQRAAALQRLTKATTKLAKAHGVDAPEFPLSHRDPAYLPTLQMEAVADFLESLSAAEKAEATAEADTADDGDTGKASGKTRAKGR